MQKALTGILLLFMTMYVRAQSWTPSSPNIYFTGGNVGIGTATPQAKLHVAGNLLLLTGANQTFINEGSTYDPTKGGMRNNAGNMVLESKDNGILFLNRDVNSDTWIESTLNGVTTEIATFKASGNVGNGTITPQSTLDVHGTISSPVIQMVNLPGGGNDLAIRSVYNSNTHYLIGTYAGWDPTGVYIAGYNAPISGTTGVSSYTKNVYIGNPSFNTNYLMVNLATGGVGIGTTNTSDASYKLFVEAGIRTRKITVDQATWPDYVFHPDYNLPSLSSIAAYIRNNGHLPDVPSADNVAKNGVDLGSNQAVLLKKIEELTLYTIDQQSQLEELKKQNEKLQRQMNMLLQAIEERK